MIAWTLTNAGVDVDALSPPPGGRAPGWAAGVTVARTRLIDDLWGERAPGTAAKMVQIHVSALRKVLPLETALSEFDGWITGRKRYQTRDRASMDFFELDAATGRIRWQKGMDWRIRKMSATCTFILWKVC